MESRDWALNGYKSSSNGKNNNLGVYIICLIYVILFYSYYDISKPRRYECSYCTVQEMKAQNGKGLTSRTHCKWALFGIRILIFWCIHCCFSYHSILTYISLCFISNKKNLPKTYSRNMVKYTGPIYTHLIVSGFIY